MPDMRRTSSRHLGYPTAEDDVDRRTTRTMRGGSQQQQDDGDNATYSTAATTAAQHHYHANVVRPASSQQHQQQQRGGVEEYYGYNTTTPPSAPSLLYDQEIYNETIRIESQLRRESQIQEQADAMLAARLAQEEEDRLEAERESRRQQELESSSQLMMGTRNERERLVHQLLEIYTSSSSLPQQTPSMQPPSRPVECPLPRVTDKLVRYDAPACSRQGDDSCCCHGTSSSSSTTTSTTTCCTSPRCQQQQQQHKQQPHQDFTMISTTTSTDDGSSNTSNSQQSSSDICAVCYEPLDTGVAVSLKMCNHIFHLDCICEALEHQKGCPTCRTDVRSTPTDGNSPSGTMFVSRPEIGSAVVDRPGNINPTVIKIEYKIPSGIQASYHPNPGMPYKGIGRVGFLPDTSQGNEIVHRLIYAFEHGLTFRVNEKGRVRWGSIPHLPYLGEKVDDAIRLACCTEELDRLGIPNPRSQLSRST